MNVKYKRLAPVVPYFRMLAAAVLSHKCTPFLVSGTVYAEIILLDRASAYLPQVGICREIFPLHSDILAALAVRQAMFRLFLNGKGCPR